MDSGDEKIPPPPPPTLGIQVSDDDNADTATRPLSEPPAISVSDTPGSGSASAGNIHGDDDYDDGSALSSNNDMGGDNDLNNGSGSIGAIPDGSRVRAAAAARFDDGSDTSGESRSETPGALPQPTGAAGISHSSTSGHAATTAAAAHRASRAAGSEMGAGGTAARRVSMRPGANGAPATGSMLPPTPGSDGSTPGTPAMSGATAAGIAATVTATDRTILGLQQELKKTWKLLEEANGRDATNKDTITDLQSKLTAQNKQLAKRSTAETASVLEIMQQRDVLARDLELRGVQLAEAVSEVDRWRLGDAEARRERADLLAELRGLKELVAAKQDEGESEVAARERLERDLREFKTLAEQRAAELKQRTDQLARAAEDARVLEVTLKETKDARDKAVTELDSLHALKRKLEEEVDHQMYETNTLESENSKLAQELRLTDDEGSKLAIEMKSLIKMRDAAQRKLKQVDEAKAEAEQERDRLRSLAYSLERQVESHVKQAELDAKKVEDLIHERDTLSKNYLKATSATLKQANLVKLHEQTKQNLETEIVGYKDEAAKQRKLILALEKERDRYVNQVAAIDSAKTAAEEEVIIKENQIFDYKKKIGEAEYKLKQQQALYEQVRSDRNLYSKNLIESQDEINEMRRKLKIMAHQIDQYKEEIAAKEAALLKEHFEHQKVDKEKDAAKQEVQKLKQQLDAAHQFIQNQQAEENKLHHIIAEAETERVRQKKEYEAVIQERDILGTQLIRRNDELALLYEKIKIQQSTLNKGEIQYRERLEDIRVLKLEVKKLRREKTILQHETTNVDSLRNEIYRLQKELLNERTRVKVLEEELENPMNMHRWRKLAGSDPSTFELVQKVQTLQRRLIAKTEQVVEKELLLQAKEKLYADLKAMLARVPGPEVVQQLEALKSLVKEKTRESKALASELNMLQSHTLDYKAEVADLTRQSQDWKRKYFGAKKIVQQHRNTGVAQVPKLEGGEPVPELPGANRWGGLSKNLSSPRIPN
ncbi:hypothetical protein BC828DRAFT_389860 [Blastocladiella britannica]|nr:hypothetical protein BC828DRAFT_389860 [Blastocladiella britannica]